MTDPGELHFDQPPNVLELGRARCGCNPMPRACNAREVVHGQVRNLEGRKLNAGVRLRPIADDAHPIGADTTDAMAHFGKQKGRWSGQRRKLEKPCTPAQLGSAQAYR